MNYLLSPPHSSAVHPQRGKDNSMKLQGASIEGIIRKKRREVKRTTSLDVLADYYTSQPTS
jgi:hypothetical protein